MNLSTIPSNEPEFHDRFTNCFNLDLGSDKIIHPFSDMVSQSVNEFHDDNRRLFRTSKFDGYFNNAELWERFDIKNVLTKKQKKRLHKILGESRSSLHKVCMLNYVPIITNRDIPKAIGRYLKEINHENTELIIKHLETIKNSIERELELVLCNDNDFVTIHKLVTNFRKSDEPVIISAIIRLGMYLPYNGRNLLLPKYVINKSQMTSFFFFFFFSVVRFLGNV